MQVTRVKNLQFRFDPKFPDTPGAPPQHIRCGDVDQTAFAEVERTAVERTDFRQQFLHMRQAFKRPHQVRILAEVRGPVVGPDEQVAPHARSQVDYHVGIRVTNARNHLAIKRHIARTLARCRIPHMTMRNGRTGLRGVKRRPGNLLWSHRNVRMPADRISGPCHRASNDHFAIHGKSLPHIRPDPDKA